jgi:hypothetical protein
MMVRVVIDIMAHHLSGYQLNQLLRQWCQSQYCRHSAGNGAGEIFACLLERKTVGMSQSTDQQP